MDSDWSDSENETEEKSTNDLVFLLFCAFIYEKRTRSGPAAVDQRLGELSAWLTEHDKLRVDVEPCAPSTLDFDDPDAPRVVDALNTYAPQFPLNFVFSENTGSYLARRINFHSPSVYKYKLRSGTLDLPFLHGGRVEVEGDISFDTVVDLLATTQNKIALTTEIDVSGSLVGCSVESVKLAMNHLRRILYDNSDDELFLFSICGGVKFEDAEDSVIDPVVVRKWRILFFSPESSRWCLKCTQSK